MFHIFCSLLRAVVHTHKRFGLLTIIRPAENSLEILKAKRAFPACHQAGEGSLSLASVLAVKETAFGSLRLWQAENMQIYPTNGCVLFFH